MLWFIALLSISILVFGPTVWVKWVMHRYGDEIEGMPGTGGELASHLIERFDLADVGVEETMAGDHYSPADKMVRLSENNFSRKSLTAIAVSAHEIGHAIQHHREEQSLAFRGRIEPLANQVARVSAGLIWAAPIVGIVTRHPVPVYMLVLIGVSGLLARMIVHAITLPTEWDASFNKALPILIEGKYIAPNEEAIVRRILRAAALTYVAGALADVFNLFRWAAILLRR